MAIIDTMEVLELGDDLNLGKFQEIFYMILNIVILINK